MKSAIFARSYLASIVSLVLVGNASALDETPSTTEGPYYTMSSQNTVLNSSSSNYAPHLQTTEGTDNDLIHIYSTSSQATGTVTKLSGTLVNTSGTAISGALIELWEADNGGIYWYSSSSSSTNNYANRDKNFQGYGTCTTDSSGAWSFLTIKPGLYTGRIRHFHLKVRVNGTEYVTSQLMPSDEVTATPSDNVVSSLKSTYGSSGLARCVYTPTSGTITWDNETYTGQLVEDRQLVINYTPSTTAPTITTEPTSVTVTEGESATFSVVATGTSPLTYQWYEVDSGAITDATSDTYTISSTTTADAGSYYCIVSNTAGSDTSETVTLTVNAASTAPTITDDPDSATVDIGDSVDFTVVADGTSPLTYQWYKGESTISGANSETYSIDSVALADAGSYYVIVSNSAGTDTSDSALLSVNQPFTTFLNYYEISSESATDDHDSDGIPNILEFLLGGDPTTPDSSIQPASEFQTVDGSNVLVYSFYVVSETGSTSWNIEYSTELTEWTTATDGTNGVSIVTEETETEGLNHVTVTIPATDTRFFARLRVTTP
ncbi:immunoglobulin domain-containing protein [Luteolibacter pohnpeiensis]|uniref:Immunoglobulin domain-containing protein n=1 Tax=Luteolibacter pohnpeiensis TaxID=454153 RepID=A0A934SAZ2_9BACT|nr:immunoglobulin domain-containing protein [Luteolibacter pohnpeiensis]MBK1882003.1 immunoglobulin domain-containing protein [Luteolibacter pohnpeiensis]